MLIVHVHVQVKPDNIEDFMAASLENASQSRLEPGIACFDVLQDKSDPTRFLLIEIYKTPEDPARHKETTHYQTWRDRVEDMMAQPRTAVKYEKMG